MLNHTTWKIARLAQVVIEEDYGITSFGQPEHCLVWLEYTESRADGTPMTEREIRAVLGCDDDPYVTGDEDPYVTGDEPEGEDDIAWLRYLDRVAARLDAFRNAV